MEAQNPHEQVRLAFNVYSWKLTFLQGVQRHSAEMNNLQQNVYY